MGEGGKEKEAVEDKKQRRGGGGDPQRHRSPGLPYFPGLRPPLGQKVRPDPGREQVSLCDPAAGFPISERAPGFSLLLPKVLCLCSMAPGKIDSSPGTEGKSPDTLESQCSHL